MRKNNNKHLSMKKVIKNFTIVFLACAIVLSSTLIAFAEKKYEGKEEVVYAMLEEDGSIEEMYVVNIFDKDGEIIDYGDYSNVRNMTTNDILDQDNDKITVNNTNGKLYYEGQLKQNELPWEVDIKYYIDEKEYDADDIAGKSGDLSININIIQNKDCDDVFFKNHALQAMITLDTEKAKNIIAEDATIANIGSEKQLTYTILPGKGKEIYIEAEVDDFEMKAIEINGIYLNLDVDIDDEDLMKRVDELLDGVNALDSGANKVKNGSSKLKKGASKLERGSNSLEEGSIDLDNGITSLNSGVDQIQSGLVKLNNKSDSLTTGSGEFKTALIEIQEKINDISIDSRKLEELSNASSDIKKGIQSLNDSMKILNESVGYSQYKSAMKENSLDIDELKRTNAETINFMTKQLEELSQVYNEIKDIPGYEDQASEAKVQIGQLTKIVELLNGNNAAISGNEKYLNTISESISKLEIGLNTLETNYDNFDGAIDLMINGLRDILVDLPKLKDGINTLVEKYTELDNGINSYTEGLAGVLAGYNGIVDGVLDLSVGSKTLRNGNNLLYQNMSELSRGTLDLYEGTLDLKKGTEEFIDKTSNIEEDANDEIDDIINNLTGDSSKIKSFTSEKNKEVKLVQFVIKTKDIKVHNETKVSQEPEFKLAFWEKFINLFQL